MRHESTGYAPYFLMSGRHPRLPVDVTFGVNRHANSPNHSSYISALKQRLQESYHIATKAAAGAQQRQKARYDLRARGAVLEPGDCVLVRVLAFEGKHKLANKWNEEIYVVESQPNPDIPVYVFYNEADKRSKRTTYFPLVVQPMTEVTLKVQPLTNRRLTSVDPFSDQQRGHLILPIKGNNQLLSRTNKICPQTLRRRMKMKMKMKY